MAADTPNSGFTVQRITDDNVGGDFVRGSDPKAIRFRTKPAAVAPPSAKVSLRTTLTAVTSGYGLIDLSWSWPEEYRDWTEVAIVRSGFGHPSTVNDGVTVLRATKEGFQFFDTSGAAMTVNVADPPTVQRDDGTRLQPGRWYYYTLFFFKDTWEPVMFTEALTPRDFGHAEHLWEALPEYYRWVDSRFRGDDGYLRQFLELFGFELDLTREYVESWQQVYNIDNSPQPLLNQVGLNLGVSTDQGLGEIRTRALIGQINELYEMRGTAAGLRSVIEASSKYRVEVTTGRNLLLLPDDSEFLTGSGNWVLSEMSVPLRVDPPPVTGTGQAFNATVTGGTPVVVFATAGGRALDATLTASAAPRYVSLIAPYNTGDKSADAGKNVLSVVSNEPPGYTYNTELTIACGLGVDGSRALTPKFNAVPVEQNVLYGFSFRFKASRLSSSVTAGIYWFDRNELYLGTSSSTYPVTGDWQTVLVQGLSYFSTNSMLPLLPATGYGQAFNAMTTRTGGPYLQTIGAGGRAFDAAVSPATAVAGVNPPSSNIEFPYLTPNGYDDATGTAFDAGIYVNEYRRYQPENLRRTVFSEYSGAVFGVPYITVSGRSSGDSFRVMGCMFYDVGPGGTTTAVAPDFYLTLGSGELIGSESGKVMGG